MGRGHRTVLAQGPILGLLWLATVGIGCAGQPAPVPAVDISSETARPSAGAWFDYEAGDAGTVRFTVVGDTLRLDAVQPNDGWRWRPDLEDTDDDVAIDFHHESEALKVDFEADIHSGVLLVEVESAAPADDGVLERPADAAANVLISVTDQRVSLDRVTAKDGWTWTHHYHDEVSIAFVNEQGALVEFEARTDDGRLEVEVETRWRPVLDNVLE